MDVLVIPKVDGAPPLQKNSSALTLFRMDIFGAAHGWGDQKGHPSIKSVTHTYNYKTWHSHTLPKEDPKNI